MQLGMIGLGRMGANMVRRLVKRRASVRGVHDRSPDAVQAARGRRKARRRRRRSSRFREQALDAARGLADGAGGGGRFASIAELAPLLSKGDTIIDGGNSYYIDDIRRAKDACAAKRIDYVDVGTSGGVWGLERGYCLMIGGPEGVRDAARPDLQDARAGPRLHRSHARAREARRTLRKHGYLHCGPSGAGHFVKMVHNGIEYGIMAAYAEGLGDPEARPTSASADHAVRTPRRRRCATPSTTSTTSTSPAVAEVWRRGSVIASWLLDLTASRARGGSGALQVRGARVRLGRGSLDHQGRDRRGGAGAGPHRVALRALLVARRGGVPE
jgi:6-phosphogluconate dehydrogenase